MFEDEYQVSRGCFCVKSHSATRWNDEVIIDNLLSGVGSDEFSRDNRELWKFFREGKKVDAEF